MIFWLIKLYTTARRAIAGRRYPHQLAWAVAFGLLLGIVPHGNLLAVGLLIVVLSLKLNHAMVALIAVAASFLAVLLDPYSHEIGNYVLTHPKVGDAAASAWALPLVPWTDLNNTVVMGSLLIGLASLVPVFIVTYPVFRALAPQDNPELAAAESSLSPVDVRHSETHPVVVIDQGHAHVSPPKRSDSHERRLQPGDDRIQFVEIPTEATQTDTPVAVETRIDVIRVKEPSSAPDANETTDLETTSHEQQPMDEALNYLLRQLRDSQQREAA